MKKNLQNALSCTLIILFFFVSFSCKKDIDNSNPSSNKLPVFANLSGSPISDITSISARFAVTISGDGGYTISARGVCWSTSQNPTINLSTKTSDGSGTGSFISSLTGLAPNTIYYVRAYATNSAGTAYSIQQIFTTTTTSRSIFNPILTYGFMSDIDGNTYKTIKIGAQTWMAENLKVSRYQNGDPIQTNLNNTQWQYTDEGAFSIYNNIDSNNSIYGKLYNWYAVKDPRGLCPVGWYVPSDAEWKSLEITLGMSSSDVDRKSDDRGTSQKIGSKLRSTSTHWTNYLNIQSTNESGFSGLPAGNRSYNGFYSRLGQSADWWSSTEDYPYYPLIRYLEPTFYCCAIGRGNSYGNNNGLSIRCFRGIRINTTAPSSITSSTLQCGGNITNDGGSSITARGVVWGTSQNPTIELTTKTIDGSGTGSFTSTITGLRTDKLYYVRAYATNTAGTSYGNQEIYSNEIFNSNLTYGTMSDVDENIYKTVIIGSQTWMAENLKTTKYRNGEPIPTNLNGNEWSNTTSGAYSFYNNDAAKISIYGHLYNWYAIADSRNLCPTGWHVPSKNEWSILESYLAGSFVAGRQLKSESSHWDSNNYTATNESGFSGLPGGGRLGGVDDVFYNLGSSGYWWSSTEGFLNSFANQFYLSSESDASGQYENYNKSYGCSVRCLKD